MKKNTKTKILFIGIIVGIVFLLLKIGVKILLGGNTMDGMKKIVFVIEDITYDKKLRKINGNCTEGTYIGEVEIYLPPFINDNSLEDGITIHAYCGEGMTMSLPPQLMGCSKIEIVDKTDAK